MSPLTRCRKLSAGPGGRSGERPPPGGAGWRGEWIEILADGGWEFYRCLRCGRPLSVPEHRRRGLGPDCAATPEIVAERLRENARGIDRRNLRRERFYDRRGEAERARSKASIAAREQLRLGRGRARSWAERPQSPGGWLGAKPAVEWAAKPGPWAKLASEVPQARPSIVRKTWSALAQIVTARPGPGG